MQQNKLIYFNWCLLLFTLGLKMGTGLNTEVSWELEQICSLVVVDITSFHREKSKSSIESSGSVPVQPKENWLCRLVQ